MRLVGRQKTSSGLVLICQALPGPHGRGGAASRPGARVTASWPRGGGLAAGGEGPGQGAALRPGVRGRGLAAEGAVDRDAPVYFWRLRGMPTANAEG